jgi:hypothetical protein
VTFQWSIFLKQKLDPLIILLSRSSERFVTQYCWPNMTFQLFCWRTLFIKFCREYHRLSFQKWLKWKYGPSVNWVKWKSRKVFDIDFKWIKKRKEKKIWYICVEYVWYRNNEICQGWLKLNVFSFSVIWNKCLTNRHKDIVKIRNIKLFIYF